MVLSSAASSGGAAAGAGAVESKPAGEVGQEAPLGLGLRAVGIADADRHLVRELAQLRAREVGRSSLDRAPLQQDILIKPRQVDLGVAGEPVGDTAQLLALALVFPAIGEGGEKTQGEDSGLLGLGHGPSVSEAAMARNRRFTACGSGCGSRPEVLAACTPGRAR